VHPVSSALGEHRFIGRVTGRARLRERVAQDVDAKRLRRLRQEDLAPRDRVDDYTFGIASLHRVGGRERGNRRAEPRRRIDRAADEIERDERPRRVVNDHQLRAARQAGEGVGDGILAAFAAFDDRDRLRTAAQILGNAGRQLARQRDNDIGNPIVREERVDAVLKDRPPAKRKELLRPGAAKTRAPAAGRNDGGHMHCDRF
jgi:hypothetical protein